MKGKLVLAVVLASGAASAKPLPQGMKVALVKKRVVVSQGGASVALDIAYDTKKLSSAELSDDGKSLVIKTDQCDGMMGEDSEPQAFALAPIQARLENTLGMTFHKKKKYADAIAHFTAAVAADPQPVYVTNLLSAQAMGGKLDDADATLAKYGKPMAPWMVWRLAVDSDLKALAGHPSTKLAADKPGTAKSASLRQGIAVSPLGFAATETVGDSAYEGMGGDQPYEMVVVELASGNEVLRLPTAIDCDTSGMMGTSAADGKKCVKKQAPLTAAKRKVADAVLASLGFYVVDKAYRDPKQDEIAGAPDGVWDAFVVPGWNIWVIRSKRVTDCAGDGMLHMSVTATPNVRK